MEPFKQNLNKKFFQYYQPIYDVVQKKMKISILFNV